MAGSFRNFGFLGRFVTKMLKLRNAKSAIRIEHVDLEQKLQRLLLKLREETGAGNSLLAHGDYLNFVYCDNIITARSYFVKNQLQLTKLWYRSLLNFSSEFLDLFLISKKTAPALTDSDIYPNPKGQGQCTGKLETLKRIHTNLKKANKLFKRKVVKPSNNPTALNLPPESQKQFQDWYKKSTKIQYKINTPKLLLAADKNIILTATTHENYENFLSKFVSYLC